MQWHKFYRWMPGALSYNLQSKIHGAQRWRNVGPVLLFARAFVPGRGKAMQMGFARVWSQYHLSFGILFLMSFGILFLITKINKLFIFGIKIEK